MKEDVEKDWTVSLTSVLRNRANSGRQRPSKGVWVRWTHQKVGKTASRRRELDVSVAGRVEYLVAYPDKLRYLVVRKSRYSVDNRECTTVTYFLGEP